MNANPARSDQPGIGRRQIFRGAVAAVITGLFAGGVWYVVEQIRRAGEAERNLHATNFAIGLVEKFVEEHRRWPKSWDELEQWNVEGVRVDPQKERTDVIRIGGAMQYEWPSSAPEIRKRVQIDFHATWDEVVEQQPKEFQAIRPIGECYDFRIYGFIESLQDTIRKVRAKPREP